MSVNTVEPNKGPAEHANGGEAGDSKQQRLPADHPLVTAFERQKAENETLRDKARRYDELEEAQKTAEQKAAEREAAALQRAEQAEARALRREVALDPAGDGSLPPLSGDDSKLLDDVTDEGAMRRLASRLSAAAQASAGPRTPKPNAAQRSGEPPVDDADAVARSFFGI